MLSIADQNKIVVISADKDEVIQPINNMILQMIGTSVISIIVCIIIAYILGNFISKPIIQLTNVIKDTASLNFIHSDDKCLLNKKDEIGDDIMNVIRYSIHGFDAQDQIHHMECVNYHLYDFNINDYPEHLRLNIQKIHERHVIFYTNHLNDLKRGIWCFIDGHKDNLSLNHLKRKVPCWEAELPDDVECYDCNWDKFTTLSDPVILYGGCYIPERELYKLTNIKRR